MLTVGIILLVLVASASPTNHTSRDYPATCSEHPIHKRFGDHGYWFSWEDRKTNRLELTWAEATAFCRERCMTLVSVETKEENNFIKESIARGHQKYAWTSGRKCNFAGCDRPDLKPVDVYGWFWVGSLSKLPPTTNRVDTDWSDTGGLGIPQPDNREQVQGGPEEECLTYLNNFYLDGIRWHDVSCTHREPFVCEDNNVPQMVVTHQLTSGRNNNTNREPESPPPNFYQQESMKHRLTKTYSDETKPGLTPHELVVVAVSPGAYVIVCRKLGLGKCVTSEGEQLKVSHLVPPRLSPEEVIAEIQTIKTTITTFDIDKQNKMEEM